MKQSKINQLKNAKSVTICGKVWTATNAEMTEMPSGTYLDMGLCGPRGAERTLYVKLSDNAVRARIYNFSNGRTVWYDEDQIKFEVPAVEVVQEVPATPIKTKCTKSVELKTAEQKALKASADFAGKLVCYIINNRIDTDVVSMDQIVKDYFAQDEACEFASDDCSELDPVEISISEIGDAVEKHLGDEILGAIPKGGKTNTGTGLWFVFKGSNLFNVCLVTKNKKGTYNVLLEKQNKTGVVVLAKTAKDVDWFNLKSTFVRLSKIELMVLNPSF